METQPASPIQPLIGAEHNDQDTDANSISSQINSFINQYAPQVHPHFWNTINIGCTIWSLIVLAFFYSLEDTPLQEREYGVPLYVIYNFTTTLVWCIESGLTFWYHRQHQGEHHGETEGSLSSLMLEHISHGVMFLVAIIFLFYSVTLFDAWRKLQVEESYRDVFFSFIAYLAIVLYVWYMGREQQAGQGDRGDDNNTTQQQHQTNYDTVLV